MLQWQAFCQISETSNSSATLELRACGFVGTSEDFCHLDEFNVWWLGNGQSLITYCHLKRLLGKYSFNLHLTWDSIDSLDKML